MARRRVEFADRILLSSHVAGGRIFLYGGVLQSTAVLLSVRDLTRFCATCSQLRHAAQDLVRAAMHEQHGIAVTSCTLGDLRALEEAATECNIDCRRRGARPHQ